MANFFERKYSFLVLSALLALAHQLRAEDAPLALKNKVRANNTPTFTPQDWQNLTPEEQQAWKDKYWAIKPPVVKKSLSVEEKSLRNCEYCQNESKNCCCGIGISQCDVNDSENGFYINTPGEYFLKENISYSPTGESGVAITINSDDVILHLCNKTLYKDPSNEQPYSTGILINEGRQNVSIDTGTVQGFEAFGIVVLPGSSMISFNQLNVSNCGGFQIEGFGGGGVLSFLSDTIKIKNSNFNKNIGQGILIFGCNNISMDQCSCDDTQGVQLFPIEGTSATGLMATSFPPFYPGPDTVPTSNVVITNSSFNNSKGTLTASGMFIGDYFSPYRTKGIVVENCVSIGTSGGEFSEEVEGFKFIASNVTIKNCIADGVDAKRGTPNSGLARGFRLTGKNILCDGCRASNITGSGRVPAAGYASEYIGKNIMFRDCTAYNINNSGNQKAHAYGFASVIRGGLFIPMLFNSPSFAFNVGKGNIFESCIAENVTKKTNRRSTAAGFKFASEKNVTVQNCISNHNSTYGFWMKDQNNDPLSKWGIFQSNTLAGNAAAGIKDRTLAKNAYIANIARSNGNNRKNRNGGNGNNYRGIPSSTPRTIWNISGSTPTIKPLDNLDIRP